MGSRSGGDQMVEVQEQLHVEQRISPAENEVHCLPMRIDLLRRLGVAGNIRAVWCVLL